MGLREPRCAERRGVSTAASDRKCTPTRTRTWPAWAWLENSGVGICAVELVLTNETAEVVLIFSASVVACFDRPAHTASDVATGCRFVAALDTNFAFLAGFARVGLFFLINVGGSAHDGDFLLAVTRGHATSGQRTGQE